jgi:hypothetical protein
MASLMIEVSTGETHEGWIQENREIKPNLNEAQMPRREKTEHTGA